MMLEPKSILRNFWLKLFSVALATVIWLGIHFNIRSQKELSISHFNLTSMPVPVGVVTPEGDPRVFKVTPSEVTAYAIADKAEIRKGLRVYVDLNDFQGRKSAAQPLHIEAPPEWDAFTMPQTVAVEQTSP
jgi:hypothetical protein